MTEPQVRIAYDQTTWVALDPGDLDPEDWAVTEATLCWQEAGVAEPAAEQVTHLATVLLAGQGRVADLARRADLDMTGFLHLPSPTAVGPVAVLTFADADGEVLGSDDLQALAGARAADLVEPAQVSELVTSLGAGVRVRSLTRATERHGLRKVETVTANLQCVWWVPDADVVVKLQVSTGDLDVLVAMSDDFDALAQSILRE